MPEVKVEEKDHWMLSSMNNEMRAIDLEMQALQQQYASLHGSKQQAQSRWSEALKEVGERAGAKGDPEKWQARLGRSPEETVIIYENQGGKK